MPCPALISPLLPRALRLSWCGLLLLTVIGSASATVHANDALPLAAPAQATPGPMRVAAVKPLPGIEINYDLLTGSAIGTGPARVQGVVSGSHGRLLTSALVNPGAVEGQRLARLDTSWQSHQPNALQTLVVGDTIGSGGGWSRTVRFGGVRFGRGVALRQLPGADLAGSQLSVGALAPLQAGASDYEVEAGRLRTGWGTADHRYGDGYAAAAYRQGLGADLTAEGRAEWTPLQAAAGVEISHRLGDAGTVRATAAHSASAQESGMHWGLGFERNSPGGALTLSWGGFDRGFTPLAAVPGEADPRGRLLAGASLPLWHRASASLTYSRQTRWDGPAATVLGLVATMPLAAGCNLSLTYSQQAGAQAEWKAGLTLPMP